MGRVFQKPSNKTTYLYLIYTCMNCARSARSSHLVWPLFVLAHPGHIKYAGPSRNGGGRTSLDGNWIFSGGFCESQSIFECQIFTLTCLHVFQTFTCLHLRTGSYLTRNSRKYFCMLQQIYFLYFLLIFIISTSYSSAPTTINQHPIPKGER